MLIMLPEKSMSSIFTYSITGKSLTDWVSIEINAKSDQVPASPSEVLFTFLILKESESKPWKLGAGSYVAVHWAILELKPLNTTSREVKSALSLLKV